MHHSLSVKRETTTAKTERTVWRVKEVSRYVLSIISECLFSLEDIIKNNILLSETKLKEEIQSMQILL